MVNDLTIINLNGQLVTESREVAEMVSKRHSDLMRDIKGYKEILDQNANLRSADFFIEHTYKNDNNQSYPCYLLTRKGCDMVANKMTGEKGVLFTAAYVTKFEEMEKQLNQPYLLPTTYKEALIQLVSQVEENEKLQTKTLVLEQQVHELKPKADYTDIILKNKGLVTITQIAKDYGMSAKEMNNLLHNLKVQYKQSGQWLLYSKYHNKGYTHSETVDIIRKDGTPDIKMNTKWTQKGRLFIYDLLKINGILPVIERNEAS